MISRLLIFSLTVFLLNFNVALAQQSKPLIKITKTPSFGLPIDCELGEDCWVMNYVDMGPEDGKATDPACLSRTYDAHKGTDFMILDEEAMNTGVNVIAPLAGTITRIRDGAPDQWSTDAQLGQIKAARQECGNAILIDHGDDIQTIYCHLKKGSITVKENAEVSKGDKIAEVGLSGLTQFPHLHFGMIKNNKIIDPFTGQDNTQKCGKRQSVLWDKDTEISYQPFVIQNLGFSNDIPALDVIEKNGSSLGQINILSDILTFWVTLFGVQEGDKITLEIKDPNGKIFATREITQDKTRARQFYYTGRRTTKTPLIEGVYTGEITIERLHKGQTITDTKFTATLITQTP